MLVCMIQIIKSEKCFFVYLVKTYLKKWPEFLVDVREMSQAPMSHTAVPGFAISLWLLTLASC